MGFKKLLKRKFVGKVLGAVFGVSDGNGEKRFSKANGAAVIAGLLGVFADFLPFPVPDGLKMEASHALVALFLRKGIG